jgi:ribosomal protein S18 acetylase RimI-like enzyme
MKLTDEEKLTAEQELWEVTQRCYTGVELPERGLFRGCVKSGDVFVIRKRHSSGEIIGYALVTGHYVITTPLLRSIAVLKGWRGHGYGKQLLDEIAEYYKAAGERAILLHCKTDNPAQTLYFKCGYRVTAVLRNYYRPEGNGLEMRKEL